MIKNTQNSGSGSRISSNNNTRARKGSAVTEKSEEYRTSENRSSTGKRPAFKLDYEEDKPYFGLSAKIEEESKNSVDEQTSGPDKNGDNQVESVNKRLNE